MFCTSTAREEELLVLHENRKAEIAMPVSQVMNVMKPVTELVVENRKLHSMVVKQNCLLQRMSHHMENLENRLSELEQRPTSVYHNHKCMNFYGSVNDSEFRTILQKQMKNE